MSNRLATEPLRRRVRAPLVGLLGASLLAALATGCPGPGGDADTAVALPEDLAPAPGFGHATSLPAAAGADPHADAPTTPLPRPPARPPLMVEGKGGIFYDANLAQEGKLAFVKLQCGACHRIDPKDPPTPGMTQGPVLAGVASKYVKIEGSAEKARAWLANHLLDPKSYPSTLAGRFPIAMPSYRAIPEQQRAAVVELLMSLQKPPEDD